jgi:hypothetical protein
VKNLYSNSQVAAQVTVETQWEQSGNLLQDETELVCQWFPLVNASLVDSITQSGLCTVYGYTAQEKDYVLVRGKKANLQVAMYYDETRDRTCVKLGMPLVNSSY